jgi:hypothetical protein
MITFFALIFLKEKFFLKIILKVTKIYLYNHFVLSYLNAFVSE